MSSIGTAAFWVSEEEKQNMHARGPASMHTQVADKLLSLIACRERRKKEDCHLCTG